MIAFIDCGGANLRSVSYALEKLNIDYHICNKKKQIKDAEALVLPGVGAAKNVMNTLKNQDLTETIKNFKNPILGICVGMQILSDQGHEDKTTRGLGIIGGEIKKFKSKKLIVPHMGWNSVRLNKEDPVITNNLDNKDFYFVHSYIFQNIKKSNVLANTHYGKKFPSIVKKGNIYGVQFHPEKSHKYGLNLIKNYILKS